jgi:hypothetical protein
MKLSTLSALPLLLHAFVGTALGGAIPGPSRTTRSFEVVRRANSEYLDPLDLTFTFTTYKRSLNQRASAPSPAPMQAAARALRGEGMGMTNAQRLARGLPPAAPRRWDPNSNTNSRRQDASSVPYVLLLLDSILHCVILTVVRSIFVLLAWRASSSFARLTATVLVIWRRTSPRAGTTSSPPISTLRCVSRSVWRQGVGWLT